MLNHIDNDKDLHAPSCTYNPKIIKIKPSNRENINNKYKT